MHKTIRVTELQQHLRTVLDEVVRERTPYVLDGDTHPEAALIPSFAAA
ncbi:MAG: type II toxin-antitoxin system Phd/YefM family antitoxin [Chloroflexota bacterium]|nr:type II toxin-antitoxin system Phd/YefM family antitoxin [Chloroflexota bacterium]